jgi:predicted Zn finger-like uncharacterized protein
MIVKCEKCRSKFNLDESLVKRDGSMARCSVCKNIFKILPPERVSSMEPQEDDFSITAMEETVALDLPPELENLESDYIEKDKEYSFDKAFEDAMEEVAEEEESFASDDELIEEKRDDKSESMEEDEEERPAVNKKGKSKTLLIILSGILFVIIAFLVIFFFFPGIIPDSIYSRPAETKSSVSDTGIAQLNFKGVAGSFLKSEKAGDIFIIKGTVINNDSKSRSYILLKGGILDMEGKPLKEATAFAGNNFTEDQLKEISKEEINAAMQNRSGMDNSNIDVKPGASIPFVIIFIDLPEKSKMVDFTVEAVSSTVGK